MAKTGEKHEKNHWSEGYIKVEENKINSREIKTLDDECKVKMTTKRKLVIYFAKEHVEAIRGKITELKKINKAIK